MRVLAVNVADRGDLLVATPALQALHATSDTTIDLLTTEHAARVVEDAPFLHQVFVTDRHVHLNPTQWADTSRREADFEVLRRLRRSRYDAVVLFHHLTTRRGAARWAVLSKIVGSPVSVGLDNGRGRFLSLRVTDHGFGHVQEADYWLQLAAQLSADVSDRDRFPLWLPVVDADRAWAEHWHATAVGGKPFVAVHPGAGRYIEARRWPVERYAELIGRMVADGLSVAIVGGPDERNLAAACGAASSTAIADLTGSVSIGHLAAVMERAAGFVGNDSFPMHVAAAVNLPLVAVFGPTNWRAWGPWPHARPWFRVAVHATWCQPCAYVGHTLGRRNGCATRPCLMHLTPAAVLAALQDATRAKALRTSSGAD